MPFEFSKISAHQLSSFPRQKTVFFFPVGPLEDHGPHLPLGLDLEEATRLCSVTAQHLEEEIPGWVGVVMPPAPLGIDSNTTKTAITVRGHVLRDWLVDACRSLIRSGFYHFVCFSGHLGPKQLTAIEEAGSIIRRSRKWSRWGSQILGVKQPIPSLISASSTCIDGKKVLSSPLWPDPMDHGGERDTSVALAIVPDLVNSTHISLPAFPKSPFLWDIFLKYKKKQLSGYWGDPSHATLETGEKEILTTLENVFPKMRAVWEGANPNSLFRSWYSIIPLNKSFFKSWILLFFIILLLGGWMYLNAVSIKVN